MSQTSTSPPELAARAPRPPVVRLRRSTIIWLVLGAASLVGGALCWSFVLAPQLRAAEVKAAEERPQEAETGTARPTELVTSQPASYDRLDLALPEPRVLAQSPRDPRPAIGQRRPAPRGRSEVAPSERGALEARRSPLMIATAPSPRSLANASALQAVAETPSSLRPASSPRELKAGSIIAARLLTAVDTSRPGPIVAVVSTDVFDSLSGRHVLVAQGSRLIGHHDVTTRHGDRRAYLTWERLILPSGASLDLGGAPGVDAQGAAGVIGKVDRRLGQLGIATLFAGAITAIGQAARSDRESDSFFLDVGDAAAIEAARVGGKLIDRELQVTSSIRLEPGTAVRVLLTRDLVVEQELN